MNKNKHRLLCKSDIMKAKTEATNEITDKLHESLIKAVHLFGKRGIQKYLNPPL